MFHPGWNWLSGMYGDKNMIEDVFSRHHISAVIHTVYGGGNQTRDFVYAGDIASAIVQALLSPDTIQSTYRQELKQASTT